MGRVWFNLFIAAICAIGAIMLCLVLPREYKKAKLKGWKVVQMIGCVLFAAMLVLAVLSMDYTGKPCVTGELTEVRVLGSHAGTHDRYELVFLTEDGKKYFVQSLERVSARSAKDVENLSIGSTYRVYGSTVTRGFFYAVEPVPEP